MLFGTLFYLKGILLLFGTLFYLKGILLLFGTLFHLKGILLLFRWNNVPNMARNAIIFLW